MKYLVLLLCALSIAATVGTLNVGTANITTATVGTAAGDVVTNGLLAWYRFDEGSGDVVADSTGLDHGATNSGGPTWSTSLGSHGSLVFDGADDWMVITNPIAGVSNDFSIALWMFPTSGGDAYGTLLGYEVTAALYYRGLLGSLTWFDLDDHTNDTQLVEDAWSHVALAVENGTNATLYLNGAADGTYTNLTAGVYSFSDVGHNTNSESYKGRISDLRVYNRTISGAEALQLYQNP